MSLSVRPLIIFGEEPTKMVAPSSAGVASGVHFFERSAEHRPGRQISSRHVPARLVGADGRLQLGMPLGATEPGASRSPDGSNAADGPNAASASGMVVLMHPATPLGTSGSALLPRRQLVAILLVDLVSLVLLFADLSWRTVHVSRLSTLGVAGLLTDGLGFLGCMFPRPRLLGLLFVAALLQFFAGVMLLQTRWQLVHCFVQPFVAQAALGLRRALIPAWFAVGRRPMGQAVP